MPHHLKILIDLNVIIDVLQKRTFFYEDSARVLAAAEQGVVDGWVAAHSLTTLFYLHARFLSPHEAHLVLIQLLTFLKVAAVTQDTIQQALSLPYRDFEDAVQVVAAAQIGADYLVTRNESDYIVSPVTIVSPSVFVTLLR